MAGLFSEFSGVERYDDGTYSKVYTKVRNNRTSYMLEFYNSDDVKVASSGWHTEISACRSEIKNHTSYALANPNFVRSYDLRGLSRILESHGEFAEFYSTSSFRK